MNKQTTTATTENNSLLWDMLTDDQKAEVLAINAAAIYNNGKARIAAGEAAGLAIKEG